MHSYYKTADEVMDWDNFDFEKFYDFIENIDTYVPYMDDTIMKVTKWMSIHSHFKTINILDPVAVEVRDKLVDIVNALSKGQS